MDCTLRFLAVLALSFAPLIACSEGGGDGGSGGTAGSGGAGPPLQFVAGDPVTVSGPSPFEGCGPFSDEPFFPGAEVEPWIAVNPTNADNMVGAWIQDPGHTSGLVTGVSFDGGATWEPVVIPDSRCTGGDVELFAGDPWLAFAANGDLYSVGLMLEDFSFAQSAIHVNKSIDGGRTWATPVSLVEGPGHDKPSIAADPEDPCAVYVGWTHFMSGGDQLLLSRTIDCGETWTEPHVMQTSTSNPGGVQFVVLPSGPLLMFYKAGGLYVKPSADRGATWPGEPTLIGNTTSLSFRPVMPDEATFVRGGIFDVAVDRGTGHLTAVWQNLFGGQPLSSPIQVAFSSSSDGGLTWSTPIRIDRTPTNAVFSLEQAFMPSVEISDDGTIGVTYYNFQNDTPNQPPSWADHWFIHCHPELSNCTNATSWSDALRLTPESFDYLRAPFFMDGLFLGDYTGLASSGSDFFAIFSIATDDDPANAIFVPIRGQ
jgi:hypothetical protein